jgi:hypothetical protein
MTVFQLMLSCLTKYVVANCILYFLMALLTKGLMTKMMRWLTMIRTFRD